MKKIPRGLEVKQTIKLPLGFLLLKKFVCFKWENPQVPNSTSLPGRFLCQLPPSLEVFSNPNESGILSRLCFTAE